MIELRNLCKNIKCLKKINNADKQNLIIDSFTITLATKDLYFSYLQSNISRYLACRRLIRQMLTINFDNILLLYSNIEKYSFYMLYSYLVTYVVLNKNKNLFTMPLHCFLQTKNNIVILKDYKNTINTCTCMYKTRIKQITIFVRNSIYSYNTKLINETIFKKQIIQHGI